MKFMLLHNWPDDQKEAIQIQNRLRSKISNVEKLDKIQLIAGVDTAFDINANILYAVVAVFGYNDLGLVDKASAYMQAHFPYIPGLHAYREGPVILKAFEKLTTIPDVILFAGHGIAHPRQFGLASHLGLILGLPSIGCTRKRLAGQYQEVGPESGESSPLYVENSMCGMVYRSRTNVKPIFISPGYKCDLDSAFKIVVSCLRGYRMPEPLRSVHILAGRLKRENIKKRNRLDLTGEPF